MKDWLLNVGLKTFGPSALRGAILGIAGWLMARGNMLSSFGIVSDAAAQTTTIHWQQLSIAVIAAFPAVLAGLIKMTQHQVTAVATGTPLSSTNPTQGGTPS